MGTSCPTQGVHPLLCGDLSGKEKRVDVRGRLIHFAAQTNEHNTVKQSCFNESWLKIKLK